MTHRLGWRTFAQIQLFFFLTFFTASLIATEALWIAESEGALKLAADPDVFGIIELEKPAKAVARQLISEEFTDYDFAISNSKRQIDFLIGWKINTFEQILFTQRRDFQEGNTNLFCLSSHCLLYIVCCYFALKYPVPS